jgi:hypothetical protein
MDALHVILFCGASAALALLVFAVRCLRRSWRALLHTWYPHMSAPAGPMPLADQLRYFWYGIGLLIAAWFVAYWTFVIWGLSQA